MKPLRGCGRDPSSADWAASRISSGSVRLLDGLSAPRGCGYPDEVKNPMWIRLSEQALLTRLNAHAGSLTEPACGSDHLGQHNQGYPHVSL